jgi:hypothetical protein
MHTTDEQKMTGITATTWDDITDVSCPIVGCEGTLRWAEAGYVPGYRICDGRLHHHFELLDERLVHTGVTDPED